MTGHGEHREGAQDTVRPGALSALLREIAEAPASTVEPWDSGLIPGAVVGRFELVRELGRGGFGIVWEARDRELGRRVAFKAVRSGARRDLREERLLREAEAAARLAHPNLVTLFDVGRTEQGPYLVFELLDGETLDERLAKGLIPQAEALRIGVEIAKGVAHAHVQGVVHRDLKPGNVFLCRDEQVKVLDFGMAHAFGQRWVAGGTPAYMAPEQAKGAPEDERTDVWAMGAILFEMLSGERPFQDEKALRSSRPAPRLEVTGAPGLGELVARALAKDPLARPRDAGELLEALSTVERELTQVAGAVRTRRRPRLRIWAPVVAGLAALAVVAGVAVWRGRERATAPQRESVAPVPSIAVLPFADLSPGKDQEYFADGVAEEILNALSHVEGLRVTGRTSSFSFKGKNVQIQEIGRQLNVRAVLEGSVRKEGDRVRITAQLVNAADGYHMWSESYGRQITGIFELQDDVARAVVEALKVKLVPGIGLGSGEGRTTNPESYRYYLMGLHFRQQGTTEGVLRSRAAFEKALALDPSNAAAQAALAQAIFGLYAVGSEPLTTAEVEDIFRQAMAAAEKAVAMAPGLADGYRIRGYLRLASFDWAGGRADLDRALALSPNDPRAIAHYGLLLAIFGRVAEGIALARRAAELDPLTGEWDSLTHLYLASGQLSLARSASDRCIEIFPNSAWCRLRQLEIDLLEGRPEAALSAARRIADPGVRLVAVALAEHDLGHATESDRALEELTSRNANDFQYQIAQVHAWRGEADRAFHWLERAWRERDPAIVFLKFDPLLRKIRGDPRYPALLKKVNLPVD